MENNEKRHDQALRDILDRLQAAQKELDELRSEREVYMSNPKVRACVSVRACGRCLLAAMPSAYCSNATTNASISVLLPQAQNTTKLVIPWKGSHDYCPDQQNRTCAAQLHSTQPSRVLLLMCYTIARNGTPLSPIDSFHAATVSNAGPCTGMFNIIFSIFVNTSTTIVYKGNYSFPSQWCLRPSKSEQKFAGYGTDKSPEATPEGNATDEGILATQEVVQPSLVKSSKEDEQAPASEDGEEKSEQDSNLLEGQKKGRLNRAKWLASMTARSPKCTSLLYSPIVKAAKGERCVVRILSPWNGYFGAE